MRASRRREFGCGLASVAACSVEVHKRLSRTCSLLWVELGMHNASAIWRFGAPGSSEEDVQSTSQIQRWHSRWGAGMDRRS